MRLSALILVLLLAAGSVSGAQPISILDTQWDGTRTFKLKGTKLDAVKEKNLAVTLGFDGGRGWTATDSMARDLTGTWVRRNNTTFDLTLDEATLNRIQSRIRADLALVDGELLITKVKAKATVKTLRSKLSVSLRYVFVNGDEVRRIRWSYKAKMGRVSGPPGGPGSGPTIVKQEWFDELPNQMSVGRSSHTSTLLDDGTVLIVAGFGSGTVIHRTAERFDPETGAFSNVGSLNDSRASHTASRLPEGKVLIVGGEGSSNFQSLSSAEIYDPEISGFLPTRSMEEARTMHTATVMTDGRILVTGGRTVENGETVWHRSAEIFDPATERWTRTTNDMSMYRAGHRATLLSNGRILITGGSGTRVAEIYDPVTRRFRDVEDRMEEIRSLHDAVQMENGIVLLTNGGARRGEIFNPINETFSETANASGHDRWAAVSFEFATNQILIIGGIDFNISFLHGSVEQFIANYISGPRYFQISTLPGHGVYLKDSRAYSSWAKLADGSFLITGGLGAAFNEPDLRTAVIFTPK
jgi:hypothetical protein